MTKNDKKSVKKMQKKGGKKSKKKVLKLAKSVESVQFLGCSCTHRQRGVDAPLFRGESA